MMEWLKAILDGATVTDGVLDTAALQKAIEAEFPKHAVPKDTFNQKNEALKEATDKVATLTQQVADLEAAQTGLDEEIKALKADKDTLLKTNSDLKNAKDTLQNSYDQLAENSGSMEELLKQNAAYETQVQGLTDRNKELVQTFALKEALRKAGVLDPDYVIFKEGGVSGFTFTETGDPDGIPDVVSKYAENETYSHLFVPEKRVEYIPKAGGAKGADNPFAKETFDLKKQTQLFKEDPDRARELADLVGYKLG